MAELPEIASLTPRRELQLAAAGKIAFLLVYQIFGQLAVVCQQADLGVEYKRANVHVAGANQAHFFVNAEVFGVQEFALKEVDSHTRLEQFLVIRLLSLANEELILHLGDDEVDFDSAHRCRLEGMLQRLIGDEIRRRHHHALAGVVDQQHDEPLRALTGISRPTGQDLGWLAARSLRLGEKLWSIEDFVRFQVPIGHEDKLKFEGDRAGCTDDQLFISNPRLERRADQVLRSGVGDLTVDDGDLAMVTEIPAAGELPPDSRLQHLDQVHATVSESRAQSGQHSLGAESVDENTALDAPLGRALERLDHGLGDFIGREDVIEQMHVMAGRIDIRRKPFDTRHIVGEKLQRIAAQNREPAGIGRQLDGSIQVGANIGMSQVGARPESFSHRSEQPEQLFVPPPSGGGHGGAADQPVEQNSETGEKEDQEQPAFGCFGRAAVRDPEQHAEPDQPLTQQIERRPGGPVIELNNQASPSFRGLSRECPSRCSRTGVRPLRISSSDYRPAKVRLWQVGAISAGARPNWLPISRVPRSALL